MKSYQTGYYFGVTLFIVFYLPAIKKYAHCSQHGYYILDDARPFCGYGLEE